MQPHGKAGLIREGRLATRDAGASRAPVLLWHAFCFPFPYPVPDRSARFGNKRCINAGDVRFPVI